MTTVLSLSLLALVILFENSLQLDAATITFMSGHALGKQTSRQKLTKLTRGFTWGVVFIWWLLISTACLILYFSFGDWLETISFWGLLAMLTIAEGLILICLILLHPNRQHPWVGASFRDFLYKRARRTKSSAEAFSLGASSVIAQLPVLIIPLGTAGAALLSFPGHQLVAGTVLFSLATGLPLMIIYGLISFETSIAAVQQFCFKYRSFFKGLLIITLLTMGLVAVNLLKVIGL